MNSRLNIFAKPLFLTLLVFFVRQIALGQTEEHWSVVDTSYEETGYVIGMPEVLYIDGKYQMYYGATVPAQQSKIQRAESDDGINWTVQGDPIVQGSTDPADSNFFVSAPAMVKLDNGNYRLYYNIGPQSEAGGAPQYRVKSLTTSDGKTFTEESGIRININRNDSTLDVGFVGHGAYYKNSQNNVMAMVSMNDKHEDSLRAPSNIGLGISADEGISFGNWNKLYYKWHDPVVIFKDGVYVMYAAYLAEYYGVAISSDGISWPEEPSLLRLKVGDQILKVDVNRGTGDLGAVVTAENKTYIYSNFNRPSTNIGIFEFNEIISSMVEKFKSNIQFNFNRSNRTLQLSNNASKFNYLICDSGGSTVLSGQFQGVADISLAGISDGIYIVAITNEKGDRTTKKILVH